MANIKSAKKRIKTNSKKQIINNDYKARLKNAIKSLEKAIHSGDKTKASEELKNFIKRIDIAHSKGLVHQNYVARQKSRLTKKVNNM